MSDSIQATLASAFEMIEQGHPDRAVTLLQPLLTRAADNPDVWWVYAHAVTDPQVAHAALTRVLRLEPGYPEAVSLLRRLEKQLRAQRANLMRERPPASALTARGVSPQSSTPAPPSDFPEMPQMTDGGGGCLGGSLQLIIVFVAVLMIAVVALLALEPQLNLWLPNRDSGSVSDPPVIRTWVPTETATKSGSATEVTTLPTSSGTSTTVVTATEDITTTPSTTETDTPVATLSVTPTIVATNTPAATAKPSETTTPLPIITSTSTPLASAEAAPALDLSNLLAAVPEFELRQNEILRPAPEGWYVVLSLCGTRGTPETSQFMQDNLVRMAEASADLPPAVQALVIEMMDCGTNEILTVIGVERTTAQKFAAGGMSENALRTRFLPMFEG